MTTKTVAALQIGSSPEGKARTLEDILAYEGEIVASGASLVVMPEALLGGYPKGEIFGTRLGYRLPEGREAYARYYDNAIDVPGPETEALAALSQRTGASLVVGVIERGGNTLYCTALFFEPATGLAAKHRKLMPTAGERLIWGFGDGSTMPVFDTPYGKIGAVICWENYMPMLRMYMYSQGVALYCAPTADDRDSWIPSMRHIALEGRCYVLTACQHLRRDAYPDDFECALGDAPDTVLMRGGSAIIDPLGEVLAGPDFSAETILYADINPNQILRGKYDFDVSGHYARPDVFQLQVDTREKRAVSALNAGEA